MRNRKRRTSLRDRLLLFLVVGIYIGACCLVNALDAREAERQQAERTQAMVELIADLPPLPEIPEYIEPVKAELVPLAVVPEAAPAPEPEWYREDVPLSRELQEALYLACEEQGIDYAVGLGLIEVESTFRENAVSRTGCYGLCQLSPKYFPKNLTPAENIRTGMEYLGYQLGRYGTIEAALTAYHAGHDTGNRRYANAVISAAEKWR